MLSRPFRGRSRGTLIVLLIFLVLLEAGGGAGLYYNNYKVTAAPVAKPTPTPKYTGPVILTVQNTPRTVIVGQSETFSSVLKGLGGAQLTYTIAYPDGTTDSRYTRADVTGYSKMVFQIKYRPKGQRESIGISVFYSNTKRAYTRFAVSLPVRKSRP